MALAEWVILLAMLCRAAYWDFRTFTVKNRTCLVLFAIGILFMAAEIAAASHMGFELHMDPTLHKIIGERILGLIMIGTLFFLLAYATRGGIGGGDVKFMSALGFTAGRTALEITIYAFLISGLICAATVFVNRSYQNRNNNGKIVKQIPFIPSVFFSATLIFLQNYLY